MCCQGEESNRKMIRISYLVSDSSDEDLLPVFLHYVFACSCFAEHLL